MLRLILMRHAKSDWDNPDLYDFKRPLNKRGRASAEALGQWLRDRAYLPDEVLCSSSVRTTETLRQLKLDPQTKTEMVRTLYHAGAQSMLEVLREASGSVVLMIGHNPGICALANALLREPATHERLSDYPTGATLVCDFDVTAWAEVDWHSADYVDFVVPRELTG